MKIKLTCPHCSDTSEYQIDDKEVTWDLGAARWLISTNCMDCGQKFNKSIYQGERLYAKLIAEFGWRKVYK